MSNKNSVLEEKDPRTFWSISDAQGVSSKFCSFTSMPSYCPTKTMSMMTKEDKNVNVMSKI